jgi:hypothetical protein
MLLSEIPPDKHASALIGLRVMGDKLKPTLTLVTECFELSYQVVGASCEVLERYDGDTTFLIALDEGGLLEIRQQHLANPHWHAGRVRERGGRWGALLIGPSGERPFEAFQVPNGGAIQGLEPLLDFKVGGIEEEYAVSRPPVVSSASNLLHVLLQRAGGVVVKDVANV